MNSEKSYPQIYFDKKNLFLTLLKERIFTKLAVSVHMVF